VAYSPKGTTNRTPCMFNYSRLTWSMVWGACCYILWSVNVFTNCLWMWKTSEACGSTWFMMFSGLIMFGGFVKHGLFACVQCTQRHVVDVGSHWEHGVEVQVKERKVWVHRYVRLWCFSCIGKGVAPYVQVCAFKQPFQNVCSTPQLMKCWKMLHFHGEYSDLATR
jgi:hypothetical protein